VLKIVEAFLFAVGVALVVTLPPDAVWTEYLPGLALCALSGVVVAVDRKWFR